MKTLVIALFAYLSTLFRSRRSLQFEIVALRHQLNVYQRTVKRPRIGIPRQRPTLPGESNMQINKRVKIWERRTGSLVYIDERHATV